MSQFILSCENKQELTDLMAIAQALYDTRGHDVLYFDIAPLLSGAKGDSLESTLFKRQWSAKEIDGRIFKEMSAGLKLLASLINAFYLIFLYYTQRAEFVLVGTPLLTYRLARILTFGNLRLVSYIRGVIAYSDENTSVSSRMFIRFGRLMHLRAFASIFSDYYASSVICTGEVTARFVASRGVPVKNIKVVGSVYCDRLSGDEGKLGEKTVVFVSSAFAFHGYDDAQREQTALIRSIKTHMLTHHPEVRFVVRRHPREEERFYGSDLEECLDSEVGDPLTCYPSNALFLSPISTLIFEVAYAGRQAYIVSDEYFIQRFKSWYESVGLAPIVDWRSLIENYISGHEGQGQDFQGAFSIQYKGSVVAQIAREL